MGALHDYRGRDGRRTSEESGGEEPLSLEGEFVARVSFFEETASVG